LRSAGIRPHLIVGEHHASESILRDGLYRYDAIGHLQEANLREIEAGHQHGVPSKPSKPSKPVDISSYIRLGPLGTALLPVERPRVLLVDELDKSDIDLPNDLLDVFEEGEFMIQEIARLLWFVRHGRLVQFLLPRRSRSSPLWAGSRPKGHWPAKARLWSLLPRRQARQTQLCSCG